EFVLPAEHETLSVRFDNRTVSDKHARFGFGPKLGEHSGGPEGLPPFPRVAVAPPSRQVPFAGNGWRPRKQARGRPNYITDYLRPVGAGASGRRLRPTMVCLWRSEERRVGKEGRSRWWRSQ